MRTSIFKTFLALSLSIPAVLAMAQDPQAGIEPEVFEYESYAEVEELFKGLGYTKAAWQSGVRDVNRVYLQRVPVRWRSTISKNIEIPLKKEMFLRAMAPLILRSNELISLEREQMLALVEAGSLQDPALIEMAMKYRVIDAPDGQLDDEALAELKLRVDTIPPSLAAAQTIEESGWGTSRFASQGNSLFGQWSWGDDAMKPKEQRSGKGNYGLASFDHPQDSVNGYMLNINRHYAYEDLRKLRGELRAAGKEPRGADLADTLTNYSERGQDYVDGLHSMMNYNKLHALDEATLVGPVILMVPVGEGSEQG